MCSWEVLSQHKAPNPTRYNKAAVEMVPHHSESLAIVQYQRPAWRSLPFFKPQEKVTTDRRGVRKGWKLANHERGLCDRRLDRQVEAY